ncbi:hypothetical protein [Pedobacter sp. ASV12]|uniref:hypothetical protein n=1 Tax=Pedobacter sp. ASV12 TaxID=2795120 RepID=UPI0018ED7739|nr:hypothetical protein [Pedobacter sp. ASV12]
MRKLLLMSLLWPMFALAQEVDRASYQKRFDDCNAEKASLTQKLMAMRQDKKTSLEEFRQGLFCSDCKRSKTEVEKQDRIDFQSHIAAGAKSGRRVVAATAEQIAKKEQEYNNKISQLENSVDGKRLDCERINAQYLSATKQAQQRQQDLAEADQKKQQQMATVNANAAANEKQKQQALAQQQALAELERQRLLQQQKDNLLAANQAQLNNEMADNNANTQSKLDQHRANNTLDDVPQDNYKSDAREVVKNTNSRTLAEAAFEKVQPSPYLKNGLESFTNYIKERGKRLKEKWVDYEVANVATIFGITPSKDEEEAALSREFNGLKDDLNPKNFKDRIIGKIEEKSRQFATKYLQDFVDKDPVLKKYTSIFEQSRAEVKKYDAITLTEYHKEIRGHVGKLFDAFDASDTSEIEAIDKEFWQTLPKKTFGLLRHYVMQKKSPVEDIKIIVNGNN